MMNNLTRQIIVKVWHTLPDPHNKPSNQTLTKNPQQLMPRKHQTLKFAPQQVWQTLNKFDYPKGVGIVPTPLLLKISQTYF